MMKLLRLPNLAPAFLQQIVKKYEPTRLGRQELNAELLVKAGLAPKDLNCLRHVGVVPKDQVRARGEGGLRDGFLIIGDPVALCYLHSPTTPIGAI